MKFMPLEAKVPLGQETSVLDLALKHKISIDHSCGGSGSCGTCRVKVVESLDKLGPMNFIEEAMAKARKFSADERLACQIEPVHELVVLVPTEDEDPTL